MECSLNSVLFVSDIWYIQKIELKLQPKIDIGGFKTNRFHGANGNVEYFDNINETKENVWLQEL